MELDKQEIFKELDDLSGAAARFPGVYLSNKFGITTAEAFQLIEDWKSSYKTGKQLLLEKNDGKSNKV